MRLSFCLSSLAWKQDKVLSVFLRFSLEMVPWFQNVFPLVCIRFFFQNKFHVLFTVIVLFARLYTQFCMQMIKVVCQHWAHVAVLLPWLLPTKPYGKQSQFLPLILMCNLSTTCMYLLALQIYTIWNNIDMINLWFLIGSHVPWSENSIRREIFKI